MVEKSKLELPEPYKREAHRLAALLEAADQAMGNLMANVDTYEIDYGAHMSSEAMANEIEILSSILENKAISEDRPSLALRIAKIAKAAGQWDTIIETTEEFLDLEGRERSKLRLEYGYALCKLHEKTPNSGKFKKGQEMLREIASPRLLTMRELEVEKKGDSRGLEGLEDNQKRAQALAALAWSLCQSRTGIDSMRRTRNLYYEAYLTDPDNPYHFARFLEHEVQMSRQIDFVSLLIPQVNATIAKCAEHARVGIELPYASFTIGKLCLLVGRSHECILAFAKGIFESSTEYPIQEELKSVLRLQERLVGASDLLDEDIENVRKTLILGKACKLLNQILQVPQGVSSKGRQLKGRATQSINELKKERSVELELHHPIVEVAGGADPKLESQLAHFESVLKDAFAGFSGTVFSGGTQSGIPGILGRIAEKQKEGGEKAFQLISYIPKRLPQDAPKDAGYDKHIVTDGQRFTYREPLQNWIDLLSVGVKPWEVKVLGVNGGNIAEFEFYLALALGSTVGLVEDSGRAAARLLLEEPWWESGRLLKLPADVETIRAFLFLNEKDWDRADFEQAARRIHLEYQKYSAQAWDDVPDDFKRSSLHQAAYAPNILRAAGFGVRQKEPKADIEVIKLEDPNLLKEMAAMEHGRWNVERLMQGWKYSSEKDIEKKTSPYLKPWEELSPAIQQYDIEAVKNFPEVLKEANLEVYKL